MKARIAFAGLFCLASLTLIIINKSAHAAEALSVDSPDPAILENLEPASGVVNVNVQDLEKIGLISDAKEGSLGRGLWADSSRKDVVELIDELPAPDANIPASTYLTWGVLRTAANASLLSDSGHFDKDSGKDILTARLKKLMEFGAYKDVQDMYAQMGKEPYHPDLAELGLLSMLYTGGRSVSCLEYKTLEDRNFEGAFWTNFKLYCAHVFDDKDTADTVNDTSSATLTKIIADPNYTVDIGSKMFEEMNDFDRAILVAEKRVKHPSLTAGTVTRLSLKDLGIFLSDNTLSDSERFTVEARAVTRGLISVDHLKRTFSEFYNESFKGASQDWQRLVISFFEINDAAKGREQWNVFLQSYAKAQVYGLGAVLPFADIIQKYDISPLSKNEALRAVKVLHTANMPIPRSWSEHFLKRSGNRFIDQDLALIGMLFTPGYRLNDEDMEAFRAISEGKNTYRANIAKIIIENLDKDNSNIHNADKAYENHFDLTSTGNYVMPTQRVWDRLKESSQNGQIGTTVLLSIQTLHGWKTGDRYPEYVQGVFDSLNTVGLTNVAQNLALGMILSDI